MKIIDPQLISDLTEQAKKEPRKRAMHCIHEPDDVLQRMINVCIKGTYVVPHKHENPDKVELFAILEGRAAILTFTDDGKVKESVILDADNGNKVIQIPPRTWHNMVVLSDHAVFFEIIEGKFDPNTHKTFASWAPAEYTKESEAYLKDLMSMRKKIIFL
jgi:cupin fold WbuC family metalloprotein